MVSLNSLFCQLLSKFMEKAMAPHSSTLAWKIPRTEEPGGLQSMGSLRVSMTERLHFHFSLSCTGEGNGNPFQYSCLGNPRDGGAWWAAVYGVAQSRTWLKRLSSSSSTRPSSPVGSSLVDVVGLAAARKRSGLKRTREKVREQLAKAWMRQPRKPEAQAVSWEIKIVFIK